MKPRENIETIYKVALSVFAEFGYQKATMEDIAGKLDMTKGNLYLYVKNKKDLYHKTVTHALLGWQSKVLEAVDSKPDAKKKFYTMCFKAVEYLSEDLELQHVLNRDPEIFPMFPANDPFYEINNNSKALIRAILDQGIKEKAFRNMEPERMSEALFMIYKMFVIRIYIKTEDKLVHEMYKDTVDLLTNGLFIEKV
jgi:AcrR family transcriptional regulator